MIEIKGKIVSAKVKKLEELNETITRPETLVGKTYKIKTPLQEEAIYITINDIILNEGTDRQQRRPFEIFINSKNMEHFQWTVALTRIISAVFRKGGEISFLIEELRSVWDPKGGYFKPGTNGVYMHSLVAEVGWVIEQHLTELKLIEQKELVAKSDKVVSISEGATQRSAFCPSCNSPSLVQQEGCITCKNCGHSKCG